MTSGDRLLEVRQVAQRLGVSAQSVRDLILCGDLPGVRWRPRGHWRVREAALAAFIETRQTHIITRTHKVPKTHGA